MTSRLSGRMLVPGESLDRAAWDHFVDASPQRTLFQRSWWLDAACGRAGWEIASAWDGEALVAGWPTRRRTSRFGDVCTHAPYTPLLGPVLVNCPSLDGRYGRHEEQLACLVDTFRAAGTAHLDAACAPEFTYWAPLGWAGLQQTTRYTWRIPGAIDLRDAWDQLASHARRNIRRAERAGLQSGEGSVESLARLHDCTFQRQGAPTGPDTDVLCAVMRAAIERGAGRIIVAHDDNDVEHSAVALVADDRWTWYLAGGSDIALRTSGAASLLQWRGIEHAAELGTGYDFEGSMLQPVERFIRGFGGVPAPYSVVRGTFSPGHAGAVTAKRALRDVARRYVSARRGRSSRSDL